MKYFKETNLTIKQRFIERKKLLKPFIKKYGSPVLVHAVDKKNIFKKILQKGELKLPYEHNSIRKTPYMEKLLKTDNGLYYSIGFVYSTAYGWKYNLIFDIEYLKELEYYNTSLAYRIYKKIAQYWFKYDKPYLEKLANKNKTCRNVVDKFYNEKYHGKKNVLFDFWKIEKVLFDFIKKYPKKKEITKIINETKKRFRKKYPASIKDAKKSYLTEKSPEIIGLKNNNLLINKHFLGFYIEGKILKDIENILNKNYKGKIIFNGKKISKII